MRALIAEDDDTSRLMMQGILAPYGDVEAVSDGEKALAAFQKAHVKKQPFDLVCLDIMMPKLDGQEVLQRIREFEKSGGIYGERGVRIVMTTALGDSQNIMRAFRSQCEAYLVKPIDKGKLLENLRSFGLIT